MLTELPILTPEAGDLLARAMFPDPERIARTLEAYRTAPERRVFVWLEGGRVVSAAGLRIQGAEVEVLHLATRPGEKGRGHARALLHALAEHLNAARLVAETDDGAVGFYRRAGFEVTPAPPRGGRARYRVTLHRGEREEAGC
ncbi:ribosomal protein S18 acetylase RimI-like enzyme [Deinococcus sp. HSC-46F16]|uniref:GNAT family N-acetyltransferase n=1 Tax=Deinococcus sp. HSC-46F16 TaxID=2910968 RepID=UPI00209EEDF7|nr:GNAT family N-acetyltransferase [Deinococcus sp. HSC-46F16]MCP2014067.1 ribosomal protein S18 acetylase RimI-like enzyme [Deinococcus sp. HSC-46F16]